MIFTPEETAACQRLVEIALEEDLGPWRESPQGRVADLTTQAIIPKDLHGQAAFVARTSGVVAGLPAVDLVLGTFHSPFLKFQPLIEDGDKVGPGDRLAVVTGLMEFILTIERTALNFLQHLSGIATLTRRYVEAVAGFPCQILDTRKTIPGWRLLEKYAVRCGGGHNHRLGLYDGLLVKDNHLAALGGGQKAFLKLLLCLNEARKSGLPLEVEVDNLDQLKWTLLCRPDIVLLDNMTLDQLREAVVWRNEIPPPTLDPIRIFAKAPFAPVILLEASGGVSLDTVRAIAETGVDRISVGALTHSATALDIGLDYLIS